MVKAIFISAIFAIVAASAVAQIPECPGNSTLKFDTNTCVCIDTFVSSTGADLHLDPTTMAWVGECTPVFTVPEVNVVPETPILVEPETPAPIEAEIPAVVVPETPAVVVPEIPTVVEPETPAVIEPETPAPIANETDPNLATGEVAPVLAAGSAAACPGNSTYDAVSDVCRCNLGFAATNNPNSLTDVTFDANGVATGVCQAGVCPAYSKLTFIAGGYRCVCNAGSSLVNGIPIDWNAATGTWLSGCSAPVNCPAPSKPTGTSCLCPNGYPGNGFTWSGSAWIGSCGTFQRIPANSVYNAAAATVTCNRGFKGKVTWVNKAWSGICTKVPCIGGSTAASAAAECLCRPGVTTVVNWDVVKQIYTGACGTARAACPVNSAYNTASVCVCNAGFSGSPAPTWNLATKKWSGACTQQPCANIRKEWRSMSAAEQSLYLEAVTLLSASPSYTSSLQSHWTQSSSENAYAHQSAGIFPWHRWYLYKFEQALRNLGPKYRCVSLPYYDWSAVGTGFINSAEFTAYGGRTSCLRTLSGKSFKYSSCVTRSPSTVSPVAGSSSIYRGASASTSLGGLYSSLISSHNGVHNDVGGTMNTAQSPLDPFFMMHHGFIDYMWYLYSTCRSDYSSGGLSTIPRFNLPVTSVANTRTIGRADRAPTSASPNTGYNYSYQLSKYATSAGFSCPGIKSAGSASGDMGAFNPNAIVRPDGTGSAGSASAGEQTLVGAQAAGMTAYWNCKQQGGAENDCARQACQAEGTIRNYTGPSRFAINMCTSAQEFLSYKADAGICTNFPATFGTLTADQFYATLVTRDAACVKKMPMGMSM